jgi:cytochrome c peroxidase
MPTRVGQNGKRGQGGTFILADGASASRPACRLSRPVCDLPCTGRSATRLSKETAMPRRLPALVALVPLALAACGDRQPVAPRPANIAAGRAAPVSGDTGTTPRLVRRLAAERGVVPLPRQRAVRPALARLGRALLFDPVLSGNRDVACATCHLPDFGTGDGRALSVGQGGSGMGPARTHPTGAFIPRNAPPLFNLAAMRHLFWDGRVATGTRGRLTTPAGAQVTPAMRRTFEFGAVSALGMFPVTNRAEMRGEVATPGNELAAIPDEDVTAIWAALMRRLGAIPEYRAMFRAAYPGERFEDMTFAHASNAMAGFFVDRLTFADTPWDRFLAGKDDALSTRQLAGARTFLELKCSLCHTGATFSDEKFHNVAVAQFGPGVGDGPDGRDDFGRMRVTGDPADRYAFRTTPLRNVELTAPYGHDGAIPTLRGFIEHYSESHVKLRAFSNDDLEPALRGTLLGNADAILATRDTLLEGVVLPPELVDRLMDYMQALTDDAARDLGRLTPAHVPSRLTVPGRGT